jgi:hypothetical protein
MRGGYSPGSMDTNMAGVVFARLAVAPALLIASWLVVGLPLLMLGEFTPALTLIVFVPVAAVVLTLGFRALRPFAAASWWSVAGLLVVAVGFGVFELVMCTEQIVIRRDPATYVQFATWLTGHGSLPIPESLSAFGGGDRSLAFDSPGFYVHGTSVVPQFMAGTPMIATLGGWLGGTHGILVTAPVVGALAILSFGGLVGRLVGAAWAPVGALALALTLPMLMVARSLYSEPPALVLMLGGLTMAVTACHRYRGPSRDRTVLAFLAGLAIGLTILVRIDGIRDVLPVVAFAGLLFALRRPGGIPLFAGLAVGSGAGVIEAIVASRPYLHYLRSSLHPLAFIVAAVVVATVILAGWVRWKGLPDLTRFRIPELAALLTVLVMVGFLVRPFVQTVRRIPHTPDDRANASFIAATQMVDRLPVDPTRMYYELSLRWVIWYIGAPAVLLATIGAALLLRRLLMRRDLIWVLPYAMIVWTTVTVLWQPNITPDQPWASRRLVSVVLPGLLIFAVWLLDWAVKQVRRLGSGRPVTAFTAGGGALLLLVPAAITSAPTMFQKTEQGEVAAVRKMCGTIGHQAAVVFVDQDSASKFTEVVRGMCGVPTARIPGAFPSSTNVGRVVQKIAASGRQPVLLASNPANVIQYGSPTLVLNFLVRQDERSLVNPPTGTWPWSQQIWMAKPSHGVGESGG